MCWQTSFSRPGRRAQFLPTIFAIAVPQLPDPTIATRFGALDIFALPAAPAESEAGKTAAQQDEQPMTCLQMFPGLVCVVPVRCEQGHDARFDILNLGMNVGHPFGASRDVTTFTRTFTRKGAISGKTTAQKDTKF